MRNISLNSPVGLTLCILWVYISPDLVTDAYLGLPCVAVWVESRTRATEEEWVWIPFPIFPGALDPLPNSLYIYRALCFTPLVNKLSPFCLSELSLCLSSSVSHDILLVLSLQVPVSVWSAFLKHYIYSALIVLCAEGHCCMIHFFLSLKYPDTFRKLESSPGLLSLCSVLQYLHWFHWTSLHVNLQLIWHCGTNTVNKHYEHLVSCAVAFFSFCYWTLYEKPLTASILPAPRQQDQLTSSQHQEFFPFSLEKLRSQ